MKFLRQYLLKVGLLFDYQNESSYARKRYEDGRKGFSIVLWVMVGLNPPFILVDFFRSHSEKPILMRVILEIMVISILIINKKTKNLNYKVYPYFYAISLMAMYAFMIGWSHGFYPDIYSLFLPNLTIIYFFVTTSFTGLKFLQSTVYNFFILIIYTLYAYLFSPELAHIMQIPGLISILLVCIMVGFLMERYNRNLFLNHQSIKEKNKIIEQINKELSDRNEMKNSLISVLSHDVNSPLASIKSLISTYREQDLPKEQMMKYWDHIDQSVDRVLVFTKETINWVKKQMESFEPTIDTCDIKRLTHEVIELCKPQAEIKTIRLNPTIVGGTNFKSDAEIIKIALRNLVSNAIKFSFEEGEVIIEGRISNNAYELTVKDSGKGIPEEKQKHIFSKHMNEPGTRNERGSGLGLSFSNMLVKQLGGRIDLESTVGIGSKFTLVLPKQIPMVTSEN